MDLLIIVVVTLGIREVISMWRKDVDRDRKDKLVAWIATAPFEKALALLEEMAPMKQRDPDIWDAAINRCTELYSIKIDRVVTFRFDLIARGTPGAKAFDKIESLALGSPDPQLAKAS